ERAQQSAQIVVTADPKQCSFQGSPIAREIDFRSSCDIAKRTLAQSSASYEVVEAPAGTTATVKIGDREIQAFNASLVPQGHSFDPDS
ncbi:hypothetical protein O6467_24785, partial [Salmonella enterica subsp. enterica]